MNYEWLMVHGGARLGPGAAAPPPTPSTTSTHPGRTHTLPRALCLHFHCVFPHVLLQLQSNVLLVILF